MALGVAVALAALAGSPPALFYTLLLALPFAVHATWAAWRRGPAWRPRAGSLAAAGAVAVALVLPMLAAARELAGLSVRAHPDFAMIAEGGLLPRDLLGALLPALSDHVYVGLLALALVPWALRQTAPFPAARAFAVTAGLGALLMLGDHTVVFRLVYAVVPGAAQFRDPTRYSALWGTAALVLAAAGLDAVLKQPAGDAARWKWARTAGMIALGAILVGEVPQLDPRTGGEGLVFAGLLLALGVVAVAFARDVRIAGGAVAVLAVLDLWPYLPAARHTRPGPFPFPAGEETLASLRAVAGGDLDSFRTYDEFAVHMRSGSRYQLRDFRGYQDPLSLGRYQKVMGELMRAPRLLATFNVRWVLWGPHYLHGDGHHALADPAAGTWATPRAPHVYEIPSALPMAYWMDGAEVVPDADAALARVEASAPAPMVVLEASAGEQASVGSGAFVPAGVTRGEETIGVEVVAPAAGFVVINEAWYPGWEARVDGAQASLHRANALVMAVRVPAGAHRVTLAFRPWQPRFLDPIAVLAWLLCAGVAVRSVGSRRRSAPAETPKPS